MISGKGDMVQVCGLIAKSVQEDLAIHLERVLIEDARQVIRKLAEDLASKIIVEMQVEMDWSHGGLTPQVILAFNDKVDTVFKTEQTIVKHEGVLNAADKSKSTDGQN